MSESSIKLISSVRPIESGVTPGALSPIQTDNTAHQKPVAVNQDKAQMQVERVPAQSGNLSNVSIHFRVDDETNDVTIFIIDRKSKKVLRSIPASELQKLQVGDLLKLTV